LHENTIGDSYYDGIDLLDASLNTNTLEANTIALSIFFTLIISAERRRADSPAIVRLWLRRSATGGRREGVLSMPSPRTS